MKKRVRIIYIILISLIIIVNFIWYFNFSSTALNKKDEKAKEEITNTYKDVTTLKEEANDKVEEDTFYEKNIIKRYQNRFSNKDIIGELSISNTSLRVPIVKGNDNSYYLNHLINKKANTLGSVFMDYRNNTSDRKVIIYGHNSNNVYTEFNILEKYLDSSYYYNHPTITFKDINNTYYYQIFSIYKTDKDYQHVNLNFTDETYRKHLEWLKNKSLYDTNVSVDGNDQIIVLQTCDVTNEGEYIIVVGKKIKTISNEAS